MNAQNAIGEIEAKLSQSRTEFGDANRKHAEATERVRIFNEKREPLLLDGKIRGIATAQKALDKITQERDGAAQDVQDYQHLIEQIEREIHSLENDYEAAQREVKIESLRTIMAKRAEHGTAIQAIVDSLCVEVAAYIKLADDAQLVAGDLELPNRSTMGLQGVPLLRVFVQGKLRFLFPQTTGWIDPSLRAELTAMEKDAQQALERVLASDTRKAA